jgi:hypothetical protein
VDFLGAIHSLRDGEAELGEGSRCPLLAEVAARLQGKWGSLPWEEKGRGRHGCGGARLLQRWSSSMQEGAEGGAPSTGGRGRRSTSAGQPTPEGSWAAMGGEEAPCWLLLP